MHSKTDRTAIHSQETRAQENAATVQFPLHIVFRHLPRSAAVTNAILRHARKLQRLHQHITECHVTIDANRGHRKGNAYQVCVQVDVPGHKRLAAHSNDRDASHQDLYAAVRDVFEDVKTQLKRQRRGIRNPRSKRNHSSVEIA